MRKNIKRRNNKKTKRMENVVEILNNDRLESLIRLRNESPVGHGFKGISKEEIENILNQLQEEVDQFNRYGRNETISYAYGWAFSKDYTDCTLRVLFDKADHYMYENKRAKKEASKNE